MVHRRIGLSVASLALGAVIAIPILGLPGIAGSSGGDGAALPCPGDGSADGCPSPNEVGALTAPAVDPAATITLTPIPTLSSPLGSSLPVLPSATITAGPSQPPTLAPTPAGTAGMTSPTATPRPTVKPTPRPTARPAPAATPSPTPAYQPTASPKPTPTPAPTATPAPAWTVVVNDQFNSGGVPSHWTRYEGRYGSGAKNCADPSHVTVSGGYMHILMSYEGSGACGAGWYTGGMMISDAFGSVDQRITLRFRVVNDGVQGHYIIPMRWPDTAAWPSGGEEDFCETSTLTGCTTFLHYGSDNTQLSQYHAVNLAQWHTMQFTRLNHVITVVIDGTVVWTYKGSSATLPDTVKRVVLQQECQSSCPSGTSGSEDIQVDWITIADPTG